MRDDAARLPRADDDYEYLRSRARAELYAVPSGPRADADGLRTLDPDHERPARRFERDAGAARREHRFERDSDSARPARRPREIHRGGDSRRSRPGTAALDLLEVHPPAPRTDHEPEIAPAEPIAASAARYDMRRQTPTRPRAVPSPERNRPVAGVDGRRTIEITGQAAQPRRQGITPSASVAARPDRVALWGVLLGLFLILVAVSTAQAAV